MATAYTLARAATSYNQRIHEKGDFSLVFPIDGDAALASPYVAASGDTLALGWIPKGISVVAAVGYLAEAGTSTTWTLGYTGSSAAFSPTAQVVNSTTVAQYTFFALTRPLLFGSSIIADTVIPGRILLVLTNTAVSSPAGLTGFVRLVCTYDFPDYTNPPTPISQVL